MHDPKQWDPDLHHFMTGNADDEVHIREPFFLNVAIPMRRSYLMFKHKDLARADREADKIGAGDWRLACTEWLNRRTK